MNRQGGSAIWENPGLGQGVVKPISFEVTLLNGETRIFGEEDFIQNQGSDPFSDVWAPPSTTTTVTETAPPAGLCTGSPCPDVNGHCANADMCCRSKWGWCGSADDHCNADS